MALQFEAIHDLGFFDHRRLIEDLLDSAPLHAGRRGPAGSPPLAALTRLGQDYLNACPDDAGAWRLRMEPDVTAAFRSLEFDRAFDRRLAFNWLVAAVILGRTDLRSRFRRPAGGIDFESGLQWFVLHGIGEHRLWHLVDATFLRALRTAAPDRDLPSPFFRMVEQERPDLFDRDRARDMRKSEVLLSDWLVREGAAQYGLFWLLREDEHPNPPRIEAESLHDVDDLDPAAMLALASHRERIDAHCREWGRHALHIGADLGPLVIGRPGAGHVRMGLPARLRAAGSIILDLGAREVDGGFTLAIDGAIMGRAAGQQSGLLHARPSAAPGPIVPGLMIVDVMVSLRSARSLPFDGIDIQRLWIV